MNSCKIPQIFIVSLTLVLIVILFLSTNMEKMVQAMSTISSYNTTRTWLTYKDELLGINIQHPSSWSNKTFYQPNDTSIGSVRFLSPVENNLDKFHEFLSIAILPIENTTLGRIDIGDSNRPNFRVINMATLTADDRLGKVLYTFTSPNYGSIEAVKFIVVYGNKQYYITYYAQAAKFDLFLPIVQKMMGSLQILNSYDNPILGVKLEYPFYWTVREQPTFHRAIFSPDLDKRTTISIQNLTNSKWTTASLINKTINATKNFYLNFTIDGIKTLNIEKNRFQIFNYTYGDGRSVFIVTDAWLQQGNHIYRITYKADSTKYLTYSPVMLRILNSFKVIGYLPYVNFDLGIITNSPAEWNTTERTNSVSFSPIHKNNVRFSVSRQATNSQISLNDTVRHIVDQYKGKQFDFPQLHLIAKEPITFITNVTAYMLNYSITYPYTGIIYFTQILTIHNGSLYSISYSIPKSEYSKYLPAIDKMIQSFGMFDVVKYVKIFGNNSGAILEYPDVGNWTNNIAIANRNDNYTFSISNPDFKFYIFPYNKTLDMLDTPRIDNYNQNRIKLEYNNINRTSIKTTFEHSVSAHKMTFSYYNQSNGLYNNGIQLSTLFHGNAFVISYTGSQDTYSRYLPAVSQIINTFKIIEVQNSILDGSSPDPILHFKYPHDWILNKTGPNISMTPPKITNDSSIVSLGINVRPTGNSNLSELVGTDVDGLKVQPYVFNYKLIDSNKTTLFDNVSSAFKIAYTYVYEINTNRRPCQCNIEGVSIYTILGNRLYTISYSASQDKFFSYLPTVNDIIHSMRIQKLVNGYSTKSGLQTSASPVDLAINPVTNRIYVAVPATRQIQVIDGITDHVIYNIPIGAYPNSVAVNPETNRIYVASPETDILYIIDGLTNKIVHQVRTGPLVGDIAVDTNEFGGFRSLVFVANAGGDTVSVIDDTLGKVLANVTTSDGPFRIAIDQIKNRAYITTVSSIDVIDYNTNNMGRRFNATNYDTIHMNSSPSGIVVDSATSRAYVANGTNTVSVLDTVSDKWIPAIIRVGLFPDSMALDPKNGKIYVGNTGENKVSIIDTSTYHSKNITTDSIPYDVAVNPEVNRIYLANYDSRTISTIDGNSDRLVSAVTFHISPPGAGHIECNQKEVSEDRYVRMNVGSQCKPIANPGFIYKSWSTNNIPSNSSYTITNVTSDLIHEYESIFFREHSDSNPSNFIVTQYGTYTFNFTSFSSVIQALSPYISVGTLITVIVIALKPSLKKTKITKRYKVESAIIPKYGRDNNVLTSKEKEEKSVISKTEIIGFNAAIITGALILLTLQGFKGTIQTQITIITASIVFPFALSAIFAITNKERLPTRLMIAGLINLMISVILLATFHIVNL